MGFLPRACGQGQRGDTVRVVVWIGYTDTERLTDRHTLLGHPSLCVWLVEVGVLKTACSGRRPLYVAATADGAQ
jgi:hypothetical protein